jgi:hypothetical protein
MDRYARQRLLAVVGDSGQERIASASYAVASDASLSSEIEREYLARAGARQFSSTGTPNPQFPHASAFRNEAAREFAAGTWRALAQLKHALEQVK